ncbi:hypothetical protein N0V83_003613 [Neocucurbitaria cava]|uniref:Uncharacterized protein n=1 Tax=Neocucurbitaria cava TaxID=798079 RepID=A0A9W9CNN0_9PLEO|nr:hypothetical protein N0V83_003613 [Neocucurbitaria cava]
MCFRCERRDHFRGECAEKICYGNPRFDKLPTTLEEAVVQRDAWVTRYVIMFDMIKGRVPEEAAGPLRAGAPHLPFDERPETLDEAIRSREVSKAHCMAMFNTIQSHGFKAELDPRIRWDIDPASHAIDTYAQSIEEGITNMNLRQLSVSMSRIHDHIEALGWMQGKSLYWRYTLALLLMHQTSYWVIQLSIYPDENREEIAALKEVNLALDKQLEGILREGQKYLPLNQARITLNASQAEEFYPRCWEFLEAQQFSWEL